MAEELVLAAPPVAGALAAIADLVVVEVAAEAVVEAQFAVEKDW